MKMYPVVAIANSRLAYRHPRRRPERQQEAEVDRVPHHLVEQRVEIPPACIPCATRTAKPGVTRNTVHLSSLTLLPKSMRRVRPL